MNCFQFDYFCGYHTAIKLFIIVSWWLWIAFNLITFVDITQLRSIWGLLVGGLWIAFNLITFVDITQQCISKALIGVSCELLSIWLLLWISHSSNRRWQYVKRVVNCFQFDYFCGYHTAYRSSFHCFFLLWIAFNLITFVDITQLY